MKAFSITIISLLLTFCSYAQLNILDSIQHDGLTRYYRMYIPQSVLDASENVPLVLNWHGNGSNAGQQQWYAQMDVIADTANFMLCYPDGINNSFNSGFGGEVDDLGFASALIDTINKLYPLDISRVYSTGMSNGGFMSHVLACELSNRIAAIASVTGTITTLTFNSCNPEYPVPIMQMHGTADGTVPYEGNKIFLSQDDLIDHWLQLNGCDETQQEVFDFPDINTDDNCTAQRIRYNVCNTNAPVHFYRIEGGGHSWPNAPLDIDITNRDYNASAEIWNFFRNYSNNIATSLNNAISIEKDFHIFPNPVSEILYLNQTESQDEFFEIYNLGGNLIKQLHATDFPFNVDLLENGVYLLKSKKQVEKLIVNK